METSLFIKNSDAIGNSKSHDFTVRFTPELVLDKNKSHFIALDSCAMSYSWYNVYSEYGNNTLKYSSNGGTSWTTITITNGNYTYKDINDHISTKLTENSLSKSGIAIEFIPSLFRVKITLEPNYRLDFRSGSFADLLGFDKKIVTTTGYGSKLPDITRSIDDVFIHTKVSESNVSGISSSVLYRFSVDNLALSYPFHIEGRRLLWAKINTSIIKDLRIQIKDAYDCPVDLNGLPVSLTLLIKQGEDII